MLDYYTERVSNVKLIEPPCIERYARWCERSKVFIMLSQKWKEKTGMRFEEKRVELKDGRKCVLRAVQPKDANGMIEYLKITSGETAFLLRNADEVKYTEEAERELLQRRLDDEGGFMMLAEIDGIIAGNCGIVSKGGYRRTNHRCGFAIALKKDYWHLGLGSEMMKYALELAEKIGYEQIELEVVDGNARAKSLYESFGFEVTGRNLRALKYDDGSYKDEYVMIKVF